jgi:hypothetical protein
MFEVYYRSPADAEKEKALTQRVAALGGRLDYREAPQSERNGSICLTFEFGLRDEAESAARVLREQGEHVEGPVDYGGQIQSSAFLLPEMLSRKFRSVSWLNKVDLPKVPFDYEERLELFAQETWDTAKRILEATGAQKGLEAVPICHMTLANGSEQNLYVHLVQDRDIVVFLEVSHCYVDQHFLQMQLWSTDRNKARDYPVDELFQRESIDERRPTGAKVAELFVRPVQLTIHTSHFDPTPQLPSSEELAALKKKVSIFPLFVFWKMFERGEYQQAAAALEATFSATDSNQTDYNLADFFLYALCATSHYWAKDYTAASRWFLVAAEGFLGLGFDRISDVCLFFAIEAGKRVPDKNAAFGIANDVVQKLAFLDAATKSEVTNILRSYYSEVYVGAAVLCRRVVELHISDLLIQKHGNAVSIKTLIKKGKASGKIPKDAGPGLFATLALAHADGVLTPAEYEIATHIKDFGNNIHDKGGVENEVDAKFAIQACLHLLHRT